MLIHLLLNIGIFFLLQHSLLANMWFQILNFDVEGKKKVGGPKKTFLGDRLQDRLSSSKINSETQMKRLCVCGLSVSEVVP